MKLCEYIYFARFYLPTGASQNDFSAEKYAYRTKHMSSLEFRSSFCSKKQSLKGYNKLVLLNLE